MVGGFLTLCKGQRSRKIPRLRLRPPPARHLTGAYSILTVGGFFDTLSSTKFASARIILRFYCRPLTGCQQDAIKKEKPKKLLPETQVQMIAAGLAVGDVGWSCGGSGTLDAQAFSRVPVLVPMVGVGSSLLSL